MSRELTDLEYAQMLVNGNASIFWHSVPTEPDDIEQGQLAELVKDALWRAVRQALNDRGGMSLPTDRPAGTRKSQQGKTGVEK